MRRWLLIFLAILVAITGYRAWKARQAPMGEGFVTVHSLTAWTRVAQVKEPVTKLHNGEHVWIFERRGDWSRIRTDDGKEGWVQSQYLAGRKIYADFVQLAQKHAGDSVQAQGHVRALSNLRIEPGRDNPNLYQMEVNDKVEILGRAVVAAPPGESTADEETPASSELETGREEWYLVRSAGAPGEIPEVGWIYGRLVAFDPPPELLDYAGDKRYVSWFVLNQVKDPMDGLKNQYLVLALSLRQEGEGDSCDFTQMRIFTWNTRAHHYETAYRENNICGRWPARLLPSERWPTFAVTFSGMRSPERERIYQLQQTVVRKVRESQARRNIRDEHSPEGAS